MSEHDEQAVIFTWARYLEAAYPELALLFAIPNGAKLPWRKDRNGQRYSPESLKLKAEGLRSGVPDMFLACPRSGYHGLFIELKVGRNTPLGSQTAWLDALAAQGYRAKVCYGADAAIDTIKEYLEIPA